MVPRSSRHPGQEVVKNSRIGLGRARRYSKSHGVGFSRVGSGYVTPPDPAREFYPTHEQRWLLLFIMFMFTLLRSGPGGCERAAELSW